jgi:hypothetical protein
MMPLNQFILIIIIIPFTLSINEEVPCDYYRAAATASLLHDAQA